MVDGEEFDRVSGNWLCFCNRFAREHPEESGWTSDGEQVWFVRLCDGRLAKL